MAQANRPSISDDMLFEALLKQGCAAEKAARIAHIRDPWGDVEEDEDPALCRRPTMPKEDVIETLRKG